MFIRDLLQKLHSRKIDYAIVGGYALAFHGIVRATVDIDLVVEVTPNELQEVEEVLADLGLTSRLPIRAKDVALFREEYIRERNLVAWSFVDFKDPTRQVDLLIRYRLEDIAVERVKWGGFSVRVASLEALMEMKAGAGRPQDLLDIEKIREKLGKKNQEKNPGKSHAKTKKRS
jgi:predicted nucleotidyltransferase